MVFERILKHNKEMCRYKRKKNKTIKRVVFDLIFAKVGVKYCDILIRMFEIWRNFLYPKSFAWRKRKEG